MSTIKLDFSMSTDLKVHVQADQMANALRAGLCPNALADLLDKTAMEYEAQAQIEAMCGPDEPQRCEVCGELGDCSPDCDLLKCGECGGVGFVPDYNQPMEVHEWEGIGMILPATEGEQWYWAKPCTCPVGAATVDPTLEG